MQWKARILLQKKLKIRLKHDTSDLEKHATLINDSVLYQQECVDLSWNSIGVNINIKSLV
jgi:hypothetical protein